ncbi:hypothetical protein ABPG77_000197 [Micractinium sp. CCAP 211/92]
MAGLISQEDGLFKVSFPFSGRQHEVHSLCTLAEAGVVGMALAGKRGQIRAAEELQQALDAVAPGRQGQPSFQLPGDAGLGTSPLPPAPFCQLAEQLQACANWRSMELSNIYAGMIRLLRPFLCDMACSTQPKAKGWLRSKAG